MYLSEYKESANIFVINLEIKKIFRQKDNQYHYAFDLRCLHLRNDPMSHEIMSSMC